MPEIELLLRQFLLELANHPYLFCAGVVLVLFASSFGLPFPEEIVLITSGIVVNLAYAEAAQTGQSPAINAWVMASVAFLAVLISDLLVFSLGRRYGVPLLTRKPFSLILSSNALVKVQSWTHDYGSFACFVFRFTPGIRFPGHFMCGAMKISYKRFLMTDGMAALLTVPTQVLLLAFYGEKILGSFKQFKIILFSVLAVGFAVWLVLKLKAKWHRKVTLPESDSSQDEVA